MTNDAQSREVFQALAQAGLCAGCQHVRVVRSARGSVFLMCQLHKTNPAFSKYPRLPVLQCAGFTPQEADSPPDTSTEA